MAKKSGEKDIETTLRPQTLEEFIGQEDLKRQLKIILNAAQKRGDPLDHLLFYGPSGLGKTTLSNLLANEMGVNIKITSGPAIQRTGDLASILTSLEKGDIFFIDEVHRLNKAVEETLYPAMEDFRLDLVLGKGPAARTLRLKLNRFTVIAATTRIGLLSSPMRDRFGFVHRLIFYSQKDLKNIVTRAAKILNIEIEEKAALEISKRARGTPRIANRLLRRVRDFAQVKAQGKITSDVCHKALKILAVDNKGLTKADRQLLKALAQKHQGGPVGIETLAATINEDIRTIEEVYEPFLIQIGFLKRTHRGRVLTTKGFEFLNLSVPEELKQKSLF